MVADIFDDRVTHTTPSAPSSARRRCRGLGHNLCLPALGPKLFGGEVSTVLTAESNGEGHNRDLVVSDDVVGKVAGAVSDHANLGHCSP
jgi:hypothetical protein